MTQVEKLRGIVRQIRAYGGMTGPSRSTYLRWADEIEETLTNRMVPSPASPSPVAEGQAVATIPDGWSITRIFKTGVEIIPPRDLRGLPLKMTMWPCQFRMSDTLVLFALADDLVKAAALSSQAPKPASAGGELVKAARVALSQMSRVSAPDNTYTDAVDALDKAIAAEADTATKGEPWVCPAGFCERHGVIHV